MAVTESALVSSEQVPAIEAAGVTQSPTMVETSESTAVDALPAMVDAPNDRWTQDAGVPDRAVANDPGGTTGVAGRRASEVAGTEAADSARGASPPTGGVVAPHPRQSKRSRRSTPRPEPSVYDQYP